MAGRTMDVKRRRQEEKGAPQVDEVSLVRAKV
jgi:hypothetical protein